MGGVPLDLARELRDRLALRRAVETGTYTGLGARRLARVFDEVITVELSLQLHAAAARALTDEPRVTALQGHSAKVLPELVSAGQVPTLWFLDGHWSGGPTAGEQDECPVMAELETMRAAHPDDVVLVDDARLFAAPPPPPHDPLKWPTLVEIFDRLGDVRPGSHVTMLADTVICVPSRARDLVDAFGQGVAAEALARPSLAGRVLARVRDR